MEPGWEYFEKSMAEFRRSDWDTLNAQRRTYYENNQASHALRLLSAMENDEVFGYPINPYRHCFQSATKVFRDGHDLQMVVIALFHHVGFTVAPQMHGEFAVTLLKPYISEQNQWMLAHHGEFQKYFCHDHPTIEDRLAREQWQDHPNYDRTVEFVEQHDQKAMDPNYKAMLIEDFEPMVEELYSREFSD